MNYEQIIRKIAKNIENQNTFLAAKDGLVSIFNNDKELSKLQQIYLSYLYFYHDLIVDVAVNKLNDKIFTEDIYEDAYMTYRRDKKENNKEKTNHGIHLKFPTKRKKRK
jgi:6-phosphogluconate dehydrogenase (decarboxylating)